ncbi:ferredoxin [Mycobacteroides abscessus subsp. abscessus]|nr:ferredoxin [Mycobacteroides abscessus subsp. abscessus]
MPKRGQVEILDPAPGPGLRAQVADAVRYCPTQALSLVEDEDDSTAKGTHR